MLFFIVFFLSFLVVNQGSLELENNYKDYHYLMEKEKERETDRQTETEPETGTEERHIEKCNITFDHFAYGHNYPFTQGMCLIGSLKGFTMYYNLFRVHNNSGCSPK